MFQSLISSLVNDAMLSQAILIPAETAVNQLLQHDGAALNAIAAESGRLVCVEVDTLTPVYVRLLDHGIGLSFSNEARPDVIMRGSIADFAALAKSDNKANQLINSGIDMDGDTELSITLTKVVQKLDIDWEAVIEPFTGSLLAHQIGKGVRGLMKWGKTTGATYSVAAKDYLEDEAQLVTPEPLLDEFANQIDDLRLATDRLQAGIDALIEQRNRQQQSTSADPS